MDTEIRPQEPTEKQKAAAYDSLMERGKQWPCSIYEYFATVLRKIALEVPAAGDKQMEDWYSNQPSSKRGRRRKS